MNATDVSLRQSSREVRGSILIAVQHVDILTKTKTGYILNTKVKKIPLGIGNIIPAVPPQRTEVYKYSSFFLEFSLKPIKLEVMEEYEFKLEAVNILWLKMENAILDN